jgi:ankyrin repeat protein
MRALIVSFAILCLTASAQGQCDEIARGGQTPLHAAAWKGDVAKIQSLIAGGADVNSASSFGTTPLHAAAVNNQLEAVKVLLQRGARIDARDGLGRTPLFAALEVGANRPIIAALLEAGAAADAKDNSGKVPVEVAWTEELRAVLKQHLAGK